MSGRSIAFSEDVARNRCCLLLLSTRVRRRWKSVFKMRTIVRSSVSFPLSRGYCAMQRKAINFHFGEGEVSPCRAATRFCYSFTSVCRPEKLHRLRNKSKSKNWRISWIGSSKRCTSMPAIKKDDRSHSSWFGNKRRR